MQPRCLIHSVWTLCRPSARLWFIKPSTLRAPASSLTQPQGQTRSSAITQQQMARNLPSLSQQITHSRHNRHCQASFTSSPPGGSPSSLFVYQKILKPGVRSHSSECLWMSTHEMSSVLQIIRSLNLPSVRLLEIDELACSGRFLQKAKFHYGCFEVSLLKFCVGYFVGAWPAPIEAVGMKNTLFATCI